jgi:hypothetical protein
MERQDCLLETFQIQLAIFGVVYEAKLLNLVVLTSSNLLSSNSTSNLAARFSNADIQK